MKRTEKVKKIKSYFGMENGTQESFHSSQLGELLQGLCDMEKSGDFFSIDKTGAVGEWKRGDAVPEDEEKLTAKEVARILISGAHKPETNFQEGVLVALALFGGAHKEALNFLKKFHDLGTCSMGSCGLIKGICYIREGNLSKGISVLNNASTENPLAEILYRLYSSKKSGDYQNGLIATVKCFFAFMSKLSEDEEAPDYFDPSEIPNEFSLVGEPQTYRIILQSIKEMLQEEFAMEFEND